MKLTNFFAAAVMLAATLSAHAEGYQINTLSTRQLGMGHTGVALKLGSESQFFNPGAMGFLDNTIDASLCLTGIMPTVTATHEGREFTTDNGVSTPILGSAAFSIYDNLKGGISFYSTYGSAINWTDNWPGAVLNQKVSLKTFTIQPTIAYRPIPNLSIGAGLMLTWGSVDLYKGLVSASSFNTLMAAQGMPGFGDTTPASVNLNGSAELRAGINVGVLWDINKKVSVGLSWRSQQTMKVKAGEASVTYANEMAQAALQSLNVLNQANFTASMPCPWMWSFGVSYRPIDRLTLALDARLTGWNAYKSLDIEFLSEQLTPYNQHIVKDYKNAWAISLGGEFAITPRMDLRAGMMIDTTPVNDTHYNPETPGMTRIEPTVGFSFRPIPAFSIDLAFMYVAGCGAKDVECDYTDLLAASVPALGMPVQRTFKADYKLHALIPSIGVNFKF